MSKGDIAAKIEELEALRNKVRAEMATRDREYGQIRASLQAAASAYDDAIDILKKDAPAVTSAPARRGRQPSGAVREAILGKLSGGNFGSMSAEDLAAATGQRIGSVRAALKALEQKGQVTQSGENWLLSKVEKAEQLAQKHRPVDATSPTDALTV
jgi:DNA-binding transcriptional ArsR family regulator